MRPRTFGKIVIIVIIVAAVLTSVIFALESPKEEQLYKCFRAVTYAILALTFATLYRYFED